MKEPKGSVLLLALTVLIVAECAPVFQEEKLPHSQEYYDGYVKALVDHFDDLFRNVRDVSADNAENKGAVGASQQAAKKDDVQNASVNADSDNKEISQKSQQDSEQNETIQDQPYTNPEQTGKPPVTDTEKEEQPTPDAHLKSENEQSPTFTENPKEIKQNMYNAEDAANLPETMQDIKFYTGKSKDFEDMRKRSTDSEASTNDKSVAAKTFVTKPIASSPASVFTVPVAAPAVPQVVTHASSPVVASTNTPVSPAASAAVPMPFASSVTSAVTSPGSSPNVLNAKRNDMESESKVISHSSSTYTPGDPFNTPPQQKPTPPDPNKEEPYKKDEEGENNNDTEKAKDDESNKSGEENAKDDEKVAEKAKEEKNEDAKANTNEANKNEKGDAAENVEKDDAETKEAEKEFRKESDEEDTEEEFASTPAQPFMEMVLLPIEENQDARSIFASAGERKDNVGAKRADDKKKDDKKDDDKKDDDDDDDEHDNHAYLAPLWGYPGWYEAGHGYPYGYGTNMLPGHHGRYGHPCLGIGGLGGGHHGIGHHCLGYPGFGHHGYGDFGYGHHGYGHHGFGHHGGLRLDNGVIWPYGGEVVTFVHTPCDCNSEPLRSTMD